MPLLAGTMPFLTSQCPFYLIRADSLGEGKSNLFVVKSHAVSKGG